MNRRVHLVLDLAAILFYSGAIFAMSSISLPHPSVYPFPGFDKVVHVLLYGGLGMLVCRFLASDLRRSAPAAMIVAAALTSLYGLSDEVHQLYVPGRLGSAWDFVANTVGASLAVVVWYFFMRPRRRPALLLLTGEPAGVDKPCSRENQSEGTATTQAPAETGHGGADPVSGKAGDDVPV